METDERPRFHLTPPSGWMNDPNGLIYRDGTFHAFYQHRPDAPRWGDIHWGHAISEDLVTWRGRPMAVAPGLSPPDDLGCWSGCIVDDGDQAVMFYTGVTLDGDVRRASICRATSRGGLDTWHKDPSNPCIAGPPPGIAPDQFRDPFVTRDAQGWSMLVGAGTTDGLGAVLSYRSTDLSSWDLVGTFLAASDLARTEGADGPCWECPQLLHFDDAAVLIVSVVDRTPGVRPSHVAAFVGRVDGDRFVVEHTDELGMGPDFYAPATATTPDGRHLLYGWVPEDPPLATSVRDWAGSLTFPRIVSLGDDHRISLGLAPEVSALRADPRRYPDVQLGEDRAVWTLEVGTQRCECQVSISPGTATEVSICLIDDDGEASPEARIAYRPHDRSLFVGRRGIVTVAGRSAYNTHRLPDPADPVLRLRVLIDGSVLELEANGRTMATIRRSTIRTGSLSLSFQAHEGSAQLSDLVLWTLAAPAPSIR